MRKAIQSTLKQVNSKITVLMLRKTDLILAKLVKNLTDETKRELNKELWDIEKNIRELKTQKRALTSLLIGTL